MKRALIDLDEIKKIDWAYLVNRKESILFRSNVNYSFRYFNRATGINWQVNYVLRLNDGQILHKKEELDNLKNLLANNDIDLFLSLRKKVIRSVENYLKISKEIQRIELENISQKELYKLVVMFLKGALFAHTSLAPLPVADGIIAKKILDLLPSTDLDEKQKWLSILSFPEKENQHTKEQRSFYNLAHFYKKNELKFKQLLQKHLDSFSWIGARDYFFSKAWTERDIIERLENFYTQKKDPAKKLKYLDSIRKKRMMETKKLLYRLNIDKSSKLFHLVKLAKEYAYLRTWRTDSIYISGYIARNLLYEVAIRSGVPRDDIIFLSYDEVIKTAQNGRCPVSKSELSDRKKAYIMLFFEGRHVVLSGNRWIQAFKDMLKSKIKNTQEIRGNIAFKGKISGKAKIVLSADDIKKVERGDILVAVMTFPHFIAAMEKASAFITDEGGILCHAAIVSREMKKPCIIGTKIATKVLKDGDMVEVDADEGIVKIIK